MNDFAAIDFETANHSATSVCSIGVVVVRDGAVVDEFYRLIKPYPNYYSYWATECHGLCRDDTDAAASFDEVWAEVAPRIEGLPLVAHNKSFDESRLVASCEYYGINHPDYEFHCMLQASRRVFPELENHQLHTVSAHVGYDMTNHHNALADAEACAEIAKKIL